MARQRERVLLTGGSGFLGSCLTRELIAAGNDVHLILRPESNTWRLSDIKGQYTVHWADLRDAVAVRTAVDSCRPEVIYHLAMYGGYPSQTSRSLMLATNVLGLTNLLGALRRHDYQAMINTGTCWEYGPTSGPIREDEQPNPRTDYARAKALATLICQGEARKGRPVVTVRVFSSYGPRAHSSMLVPYVMGCCLRGMSPRISAGWQVRDLIHVDDVITLLRIASDHVEIRGEILHAGTGQPQRVRDIVRTTLEICSNGRVTAEFGAESMRPGEPAACIADIGRTSALTGWKPRYDLAAGIARTWAWFRTAALERAA